jgi:hypothetical protein
MSPVKRSTRPAALVVAAALALSGCTGHEMREGAVINGTSYSMQELQEAVAQIDSIAVNPVGVPGIVYEAAVVHLIDDAFHGSPYTVSDAQLASTMREAGLEGEPNELALDSARFRHYASILQAPGIQEDPAMGPVLEQLNAVTQQDILDLDVEVNPRYGTWAPEQGGVVAEVPSWIRPAGTS